MRAAIVGAAFGVFALAGCSREKDANAAEATTPAATSGRSARMTAFAMQPGTLIRVAPRSSSRCSSGIPGTKASRSSGRACSRP